jgi:hypothetical protein
VRVNDRVLHILLRNPSLSGAHGALLQQVRRGGSLMQHCSGSVTKSGTTVSQSRCVMLLRTTICRAPKPTCLIHTQPLTRIALTRRPFGCRPLTDSPLGRSQLAQCQSKPQAINIVTARGQRLLPLHLPHRCNRRQAGSRRSGFPSAELSDWLCCQAAASPPARCRNERR